MKQRSNSMSAFCTQRSAILFSILVGVKPGVFLRTMKAFTCTHDNNRSNSLMRSQTNATFINQIPITANMKALCFTN
jgi:hypothetical protein